MKNMLNFNFISKSLFWIFVFFLLLQHSFSYLDPDFSWHLDAGKRTYLNSEVVTTNDHNFSFPSNLWLDHEWLADLGMYLAYENLGYPFINLFFVIIALLAIFLLYKQVSKNQPQWITLTLLLFGTIAMAPHLGVRIQEFTVLFTIIIFILLSKYQKNLAWKILIPIPFVIWLWANLHAGFLLGLIMIGIFGLIKILDITWPKISHEKKLNQKDFIILIGIGLISLGLTFINPYGLKLYSFLFSYQDTFYLNHIAEWLPQWDYPYQYWQLSYIAITIMILYVVIKNKAKDSNLFEIFLVIFLMITAIKSRRNFPLLLAVSFPLITRETIRALYPNNTNKKTNNFLKICLIFSLIFLISSQILTLKIIKDPFSEIKNTRNANYPYEAVEWLKNQEDLQNKRIFNEFSWGGYIIWQYPEAKIFIDGRQPQAKMTEVSALEEYYNFYQDGKAKDKLSQHNIELVLLKKEKNEKQSIEKDWKRFLVFNYKTIEQYEAKNELLDYLKNSSDWDLVYQDNETIIYNKIKL